MVSEESERTGSLRRDFLKVTGSGGLMVTLAGCPSADDEGGDTTGTDGGSDSDSGGGGDDEGGEDDTYVASVAAIDREVDDDADDSVRATFSEEYYERLEGDRTGVDAPGEVTPVGHAVKYGHRTTVAGEGADEGPTLRRLSLGTLTVPAPEAGEATTPFASAALSEIVAPESGQNAFLAAAGLGGTVDWLEGPVSMERGDIEFLDGTGTAETFVGIVSAVPGPGVPIRGGGPFGSDGSRAEPMVATIHTARTTVGDSVVMVGMIEGFRRPPTMGPGGTDIGEDLQDLLGEVYDQVANAELFERSIDGVDINSASALPGRDERPPPPRREEREPDVSATVGLDDHDQIELGYQTRSVDTDRATTAFVVGRDVPGLFEDEEFDEDVHSRGTSITLKAQFRAATYPVEGSDSIAFGTLVSPLVEIDGKARNPLATESLSTLLLSVRDLSPLITWMGSYQSYSWSGSSSPTTFETLSGLDLLGEDAELTGLRGQFSARTDNGDLLTGDDAVAYVARARTSKYVVIAMVLTRESTDGFFGGAEAAKRLFRECVPRTRFRPETPSTWVDGSIDELNLVQICRDTRLETASGDVLPQSDPDLVTGRFTAPIFDVTTFFGTSHSSNELQYGVFQFDVANRSGGPFETVLDSDDVDALDRNLTSPDLLFDGNTDDGTSENELPVFELLDTDSSVTMEFRAPCGYVHDSRTLTAGSDYSIAEIETFRIGFITVVDPDGGDNYGDGSGRPTDYRETVDAAFEYLKRTYPTGLAVYRHDDGIQGATKFLSNDAKENDTPDYRNARVALEKIAKPGNNNWSYSGDTMAHKSSVGAARQGIRNNGFDVWVLIVPDGYYQFHVDDSRPGGLAPWNDDLAVTTAEGARHGRATAASIVAQEIGHRIERYPYRLPDSGAGMDNPLAQRDDEGTDIESGPPTGNRDFDHARHLDSNEDGDTPADGPGLVSRAYSLAEGEFVVPGDHEWDGGYSIQSISEDPTPLGVYGPTRDFQRVGRVESYMSYTDRQPWADSLITQDIVDSDLRREAGNFQTFKIGGVTEVNASAAGGSGGDEESVVVDVQAFEDYATEPNEERLEAADEILRVAVFDPDGEQVAETRTTVGVPVLGHEVEDELIEDVATFDVELPTEAVDVSLESERVDLGVNPLTRPIRDAFGRIPERGFSPDADFDLGILEERLAEVDAAMEERQFSTARDQLIATFEAEVPGTIDPEFEPLANQPDEARLTALFEEMIGRLDGLAGDETATSGGN